MKLPVDKISKKIREMRENKNFTQEALAKELGVSRQSVIAIEQGRCLPSLPLALALSDLFDATFESIFCDQQIERREIEIPSEIVRIVDTDGREVNQMNRDLMPWGPFRELNTLHETLDKMFDDGSIVSKSSFSLPAVNIFEKDNSVIVQADLPGVKEEDLSIEVGENHLTLRGERKAENEVRDKDYYRKEMSYGSFSRVIPLPSDIDKDKAEAELKDGILTITLPKATKEAAKVNKIKVRKV